MLRIAFFRRFHVVCTVSQEFISEYGLDPGVYVQELVDQFCDRCTELTERTVEEAIFVDEGPIDYLMWFVLDDYETHTFFYYDDDSDQEVLQRFIFLSPSKEEIPKFKRLLRTRFGVYRELDIARLLELRDIYQPQFGERPRANLGICHEPGEDRVVAGISGTPRIREQEIFEDVDKIVPDKSLEKFISRTVRTVNTQIKDDADRHTIRTDIQPRLEVDPDFRWETTKPLPEGIHPKYTETEADLWQKPASKVEYMAGSQGFLQIWIPVDEDDITLVSATAGGYDREAIVDSIREEFETVCA